MAKLVNLSHRKSNKFKHSTKGWIPMRKLTTSLFFASTLLAGVLTAPALYAEGMQSEQCDMMRGRQGGMMGHGGMMGGDGMMQGDRGGMMGRSGMMQGGQEGMIGMMKQMSQMMRQMSQMMDQYTNMMSDQEKKGAPSEPEKK